MEKPLDFDVAVIGSGPGGYVAAIKLAQKGKKVALIEKKFLGGTCLNVGCIPTKTLLTTSSLLEKIKHATEFGIEVGSIKIAYDAIAKRKTETVQKIRQNLQSLIKTNKITIFEGNAEFTSPNILKIQGKENCLLAFKNAIIATGSVPVDIKAFPADHKKILDSTSVLELTQLPKSMLIVGGGYIGCEFASFFQSLGCQVTILEASHSILSLQGDSIATFMTQQLTNQGISIKTNVKVTHINKEGIGVEATFADGGKIKAELALIAVGRKPFTDNLHLEKALLSTDEKGFIAVNDQMQTDQGHIYAIGDVTGKAMLAHAASHMGMVAASSILETPQKMDFSCIPAVIFTSPEVATVGLSENQAKEMGYNVQTGKFPFAAIGKAECAGETIGFAEIVADKKTNQILGATVIGHDASNLIAEMTLAIQNEIPVECVIDTIHAHPTMAEVWSEAAQMLLGTPLHLPMKKM